MKNPLARIPSSFGVPAFLGVVAIMALMANYLGGDYFKRTFLDEADPLAGLIPASTAAPGLQPADAGAAVLASGEFRDGDPGHNGEGVARLIRGADGNLVLRFEDFSVTNGPDLFVILSRGDEYAGEGALDLGRLKATDGNVNYEVPAGTDVMQYRSVIIWCRQFRVTFAVAPLSPAAAGAAVSSPGSAATTTTQGAASPSPSASAPATQSASTPSPTAASSTQPTGTPIPTQAPAGPALLAEGTFRDGDPGHNGEGVARLIRDANGNHILRFEGFSVTNGPDLFVILSRVDGYSGDGALDLGRLKATDGNINYDIPAGTDVTQFKSVVIWCRQFSVTFAIATFGGQ
ncbi:MAG: DM13 domain-containing protein [Dehalococcoidia bacterium]